MKNAEKNYFIPIYLIISFGVLVAFFIVPMALSMYFSFTNTSLYNLHNYKFIGFSNYESLFTSRSFYHSVTITLLFLLLSAIVGQAFLGLILASLLNSVHGIFRGLVITSILLAWATPQVTGGILWSSTLSSTPPRGNSFIDVMAWYAASQFSGNPLCPIFGGNIQHMARTGFFASDISGWDSEHKPVDSQGISCGRSWSLQEILFNNNPPPQK